MSLLSELTRCFCSREMDCSRSGLQTITLQLGPFCSRLAAGEYLLIGLSWDCERRGFPCFLLQDCINIISNRPYHKFTCCLTSQPQPFFATLKLPAFTLFADLVLGRALGSWGRKSKHFYKFAGCQRAVLPQYFLQYKTNMNKKFKQTSLTEMYPVVVPFKTAIPEVREAVKLNYCPQRENFNSNSSTRLNSKPERERQFEREVYKEHEDPDNENALNFNQFEEMKKARQAHFEELPVEESCPSATAPLFAPSKIKVNNHQNSLTNNPKLQRQTALAQEIKKQSPQQDAYLPPKKKKIAPPAPPLLNLAEGESSKAKVDKILQSTSLRDKFNHLLVGDEKYFIGHKHTRLLKIMEAIDNTISFIGNNRGGKFMFFNDLQRSLKDHNNRMEIREDHLQQLIFIDDSLYIIEWIPNLNKKYALRLQLPEVPSFDRRRFETRKKVVNYLLTLQAQFAAAKNIPNLTIGQWIPGFDPEDYDIPRKPLPSHPNCRGVEIKQLTDREIDAVANPTLKKFMKKRKLQEQQKSLNSQQVSSMILMKNLKAKSIVEKAIKQKEQQVALMLQSEGQEKLQKSVVLDICTEMLMMYMSASTSHMFRDNVQESLNRRLRYKEGKIMQSLRFILQSKEVGFLNEVKTSERPVLRMDRSKFDEMRRKIDKIEVC